MACKEWNGIPEDGLNLLGSSYDNTGALGASTWRHVAFIEQTSDRIETARESGRKLVDLGMPAVRPIGSAPLSSPSRQRRRRCRAGQCGPSGRPGRGGGPGQHRGRDRHHPGLPLADVLGRVQALHPRRPASTSAPRARCSAPSSARSSSRTTSATAAATACRACPFGVIERRPDERHREERRHRPEVHPLLRPARRRTRPRPARRPARRPRSSSATSTRCGPRRRRAWTTLHANGFTEARLYGANANDGVGGTGSMFLLLDEPEVYGLPPDPRVHDRRPARHVPQGRLGGAGDARHGSRLVPRETPMTTNPFDADRPPEPLAPARATAPAPGTGRRRRDESMMVPDVEFESYYGRNIVKAPPWEHDIPAYLFLGGLAAGSALLGAGGAARNLPALRRGGRVAALIAVALGGGALAKDLGRPEPRPQHDAHGQAHLADVGRLVDPDRLRGLRRACPVASPRPGGVRCPTSAPCWPRPSASPTRPPRSARRSSRPRSRHTPPCCSPTPPRPTWHESYRELPFVFVGSANAAAAGLALVTTPTDAERAGAQARGGGCRGRAGGLRAA